MENNPLKTPLPLRNNLPVNLFLYVVVPCNDNNYLISDMEVPVILVLAVGTKAVKVLLQTAEDDAAVFARNHGRPSAVDRMSDIRAVKRIRLRVSHRYRHNAVGYIKPLHQPCVYLICVKPFPQICLHPVS